jgi:alkylation response protein AidB-like acyl-CoA dehydrogenase
VDFRDSPDEAAFRAEARSFLDAFAAPHREAVARARDRADHMACARRWQATLCEHGFGAVLWPEQHGGRGLAPVFQIVWNQELARAGVGESVFVGAIGMVGPTIIAFGSDAQKRQHLAPMLRGDALWCQLFSEPGAGSDLASVSTRAVRDGDDWIVRGQKVWSSFADFADWGFLLVRSDPRAPKHRGITYLLVDMRSPGIEVRPLREMTGGTHFNEVFFEGVRVPDRNRLGGVGEGWAVARTTLAHERMAMGGAQLMFSFEDLAALARSRPEALDDVARDELARLYCWSKSLELLGARVTTMIGRGLDPSAESSVMKLAMARILSRAADLALRLQGEDGVRGRDPWQHHFLFAPSMHIGGGTDEIQKNVAAERVLGLPREPDPLRDLPFDELPRS